MRETHAIHTLFRSGLLALSLAACGPAPADASSPTPPPPDAGPEVAVQLEPVASGLTQPTALTHAGDGTGRLFVTEKTGLVRVIEGGALLAAPFLDLSGAVSSGSEQGLLGLAFHPDYAQNGRLFVNYTDTAGDTVIAEYAVSGDPSAADPASARVLLSIPQPYANHNGGGLAFAPDGTLYIGTGDGGAGGDPEENGQDTGALLGKMLRLSVDEVPGGEAYGVPQDNPLVGTAGARPEVWAYGLRNPWRFSFDRETGDLWIADVGQNAFEEVNLQPAASAGGENYGWNTMEASSCFEAASCDQEGLVLPVLEYSHASGDGRSVTGGYVYRGAALPGLVGSYVFGDFVSGRVWRGAPSEIASSWARTLLLETDFAVSAFGEDEAGELYLLDFGGGVYRFAPAG